MLLSQAHRRYNPLKDEWILVSPNRTLRPWQGQQEKIKTGKRLTYNTTCYMCPGNKRAHGEKNPQYKNTFVFTNDFPALIDTTDEETQQGLRLFKTEKISGTCRVVCFSERHDLTLADMTVSQIGKVVRTWIDQAKELGGNYKWVQIFENKGELMGCSNPHPHGQIWASNFIPNEIQKEDVQQKKYFEKNNSILLIDYLKEELQKEERLVLENDNWVVVVPFWATWPYETLLLPKANQTGLINLSTNEISDLAKITKKLLVAYDRLFNTSMPYSMGWHFTPFNRKNNHNQYWQLHAHYYPPLLRSATVKKFMVGYEMLSEPQRDITPEQAAEKLRKLT